MEIKEDFWYDEENNPFKMSCPPCGRCKTTPIVYGITPFNVLYVDCKCEEKKIETKVPYDISNKIPNYDWVLSVCELCDSWNNKYGNT